MSETLVFESRTLIGATVRVGSCYLGEGRGGDCDPQDPDDEPLLRFDVERQGAHGQWHPVADASYCTQLNARQPEAVLDRALAYLIQGVGPEVAAGDSIKHLGEKLSWLDETVFGTAGTPAPCPPTPVVVVAP